jgi:hypothetical protein
MSTVIPSIAGWQADFLRVLPTIECHAKYRFRCLPGCHREEAIQETIALAVASYRNLNARNRLCDAHPGTIAEYAIKRAAAGRHAGGRQETTRDAMSPVALRRRGAVLESYEASDCERDEDAWRCLITVNRKTDIPSLACFRIDFAEWLRSLRDRDRRIIAAMANGAGTAEVANRFQLTPGRVSQLRRKYKHLWRTFQGEAVQQTAA